jgi:hypothetical protein
MLDVGSKSTDSMSVNIGSGPLKRPSDVDEVGRLISLRDSVDRRHAKTPLKDGNTHLRRDLGTDGV